MTSGVFAPPEPEEVAKLALRSPTQRKAPVSCPEPRTEAHAPVSITMVVAKPTAPTAPTGVRVGSRSAAFTSRPATTGGPKEVQPYEGWGDALTAGRADEESLKSEVRPTGGFATRTTRPGKPLQLAAKAPTRL